jgi:putative mRNA 3-end processing factor
MKNAKHLDFGQEETIGDMKLKLFNAGHTPGSAQVLLDADGKKILYTGDFNMEDSKLLTGASMDYNDLDAIVIESTYANEDHTPRPELEKRFVEAATDIVERGGTVLIPAFGVGRAQEIA